MENEVTRSCPFNARSCIDECALVMHSADGGNICAFTVIALSLNMQSNIMASDAQARQQAMMRDIGITPSIKLV